MTSGLLVFENGLQSNRIRRVGKTPFFGAAFALSVGLFFLLNTPVAAQPAAPSSEPAAARSAAEPSSQPAEPGDWTKGPCGSFAKRLEEASTPLEECGVRLLIARCVLVEQCAPRLSARCFSPAQRDEVLAGLTSDGLAMLDLAAAALDRARSKSSPESDADTLSDLEDRIGMLRAFGELFAAMADDPSSEAGKTGLLSACNRLAVQLDSENPKVAGSAKLWMAVAYRMAGRADRAAQLVRPMLGKPGDPAIDLAARLQHCLAMGDQGEYVAALGLSLRLKARAERWFADEERVTRRRAMAAIRFTRVELLRGWAEKLRAADETGRAAAAQALADKLLGADSWPPAIERRLILTESIAGLPSWETEAQPPTEPSPDPAGRVAG